MGYYDYNELKNKAISGNFEDKQELANWLDNYYPSAWNGEYYQVDGLRMRPVYSDDLEIVDYEIN